MTFQDLALAFVLLAGAGWLAFVLKLTARRRSELNHHLDRLKGALASEQRSLEQFNETLDRLVESTLTEPIALPSNEDSRPSHTRGHRPKPIDFWPSLEESMRLSVRAAQRLSKAPSHALMQTANRLLEGEVTRQRATSHLAQAVLAASSVVGPLTAALRVIQLETSSYWRFLEEFEKTHPTYALHLESSSHAEPYVLKQPSDVSVDRIVASKPLRLHVKMPSSVKRRRDRYSRVYWTSEVRIDEVGEPVRRKARKLKIA